MNEDSRSNSEWSLSSELEGNRTSATAPLISYEEAVEHFRGLSNDQLLQWKGQARDEFTSAMTTDRGCLSCCAAATLGGQDPLENDLGLMVALGKVPFETGHAVHERILVTVYKLCASLPLCHERGRIPPLQDPDVLAIADPDRVGPHWVEIGFQGNDPTTDLRGVGLMGLISLLGLLGGTPEMRYRASLIFRISQSDAQEFPFAALSINICRMALNVIRSGKGNRVILSSESVPSAFVRVFNAHFAHFALIWRLERCTIHQAGNVLKRVEKSSRGSLARAQRSVVKGVAIAEKEM